MQAHDFLCCGVNSVVNNLRAILFSRLILLSVTLINYLITYYTEIQSDITKYFT